MAIERNYIGARYVPLLYTNSNGTNDWVSGIAYEPLTIVSYNGASYTSKKRVPTNIGNPADNTAYWVLTGNYNSQIAHLEDDISAIDGRVDDVEDSVDDLDGELSTTQSSLATTQSDLTALAGRVTTAEGQLSTVNNRISNAINAKVTCCTAQSLNLNQNTVTTQDIIDAIGSNRGVVFVDYFSGSTAIASEIGTSAYICVIIWVSNNRAGGIASVQSDSNSLLTKCYSLNHYPGSPSRNTWLPVDRSAVINTPITIDSSFSSIMSFSRQRAYIDNGLATISATVTFPNNDVSGEWGDLDTSLLPAHPADFAIAGKQGFGRGYITTTGKIGFFYSKVNADSNATVSFCVTYKTA